MSRFTGPHTRRGDINPPAALVSLSKKLLGELATRMRLGGPPSLVIRRETEEGFVEARMVYGKPQVFITVNPVHRSPQTVWEGFVLRPTTSAMEVWGGSSYGTFQTEIANSKPAMLAVRLAGAEHTPLITSWHAADTLPEGAPSRFHGEVFPDGLRYVANVDWQGKLGVVHFFGPDNRYSAPEQFFGHVVLRNGQVLLTASAVEDLTGTSGRVYGAALAQSADGLVLRVVVGDTTESFTTMQYRALSFRLDRIGKITGPLHLQPRLKLALDADGLPIGQVDATITLNDDTGYRHPFHFNSNGTEARAIVWRNVESDALKVPVEVVLVYSETASASFSDTMLAGEATTRTVTITTSGSVSAATGSMLNVPDAVLFPARTGVPMPAWPTGYADTTAKSSPWVKVAVDYRDDAPVYLEARGGSGVVTEKVGVFTRSSFGAGKVLWSEAGGEWVHWTGDDSVEQDATVDATTNETTTVDYSNYAIRADFIELVDVEQSETTIEDARSTTVDTTLYGTIQGTIDGAGTIETNSFSRSHIVSFIDLRNKIACYRIDESSGAISESYTDNTHWLANLPTPATGVTRTITTTSTTTGAVRLMVGGVLVEDDAFEVENPSNTNTSFYPASNPFGYQSFDLLLIGPPYEAGASSSTTTEVVGPDPPSTSFINLDHHEDASLSDFGPWLGSWAVSRDLVAYSYSYHSPEWSFGQPNRYGLCTTSGKKILPNWPERTGATAAADYLRFSPIYTVSPFIA